MFRAGGEGQILAPVRGHGTPDGCHRGGGEPYP